MTAALIGDNCSNLWIRSSFTRRMIALAMVCSDAAPGGERPIRRDGALFAGDAADSRADAGRSSCKRGDAFWGESGRCSSTVPQWGPVERGPPLPQKANRSDAARGFLEGTGRTQAEASSREPDRRRSTRLAKRRVTLRCGRDGRLAAGGSQASAGSSGAPAGTSAGARACGPSAGPAGAPPGRRSARHGGHAGSGPKRPSSGLRERCRARGWRLTLATEQRCRGAIRRGRDHGLDVSEPRRPGRRRGARRCAPRCPDLDFRIWPEVGDPAEIDVALVWQPPPGELARYPNLRAILSLGAGIDGLLAQPGLPDVPIARMVDPSLTRDHDRVRGAGDAPPSPPVRPLRARAAGGALELCPAAAGRRPAGRRHGAGRARQRCRRRPGEPRVPGRRLEPQRRGSLPASRASPAGLASLRSCARTDILVCLLPLTAGHGGHPERRHLRRPAARRLSDQRRARRPSGRGRPDRGPGFRPAGRRHPGRVPRGAAAAGQSALASPESADHAPCRQLRLAADGCRRRGGEHPPRARKPAAAASGRSRPGVLEPLPMRSKRFGSPHRGAIGRSLLQIINSEQLLSGRRPSLAISSIRMVPQGATRLRWMHTSLPRWTTLCLAIRPLLDARVEPAHDHESPRGVPS